MYPYEFFYEVEIKADHPITNLSVPSYTSIVEQSEGNRFIRIQSSQPDRAVDLYYRTADMMYP